MKLSMLVLSLGVVAAGYIHTDREMYTNDRSTFIINRSYTATSGRRRTPQQGVPREGWTWLQSWVQSLRRTRGMRPWWSVGHRWWSCVSRSMRWCWRCTETCQRDATRQSTTSLRLHRICRPCLHPTQHNTNSEDSSSFYCTRLSDVKTVDMSRPIACLNQPFDAHWHCCHMGTAIKHPAPDRVKPSFVTFDILALWRSGLSVRVPRCQKNYKRRLNPACHIQDVL